MNIEEFKQSLTELNVKITEEQLSSLSLYASFLVEYNNHTNLTAITKEEDIYLKHFYDSLTITKGIDLNKINTLIDIGTGAGFPGMVIAIMFPSIKVTLVDSNNKKCKFLEELKNKLSLNNVDIYNERSEDFALKHIDEYDCVTARAVTQMPILTELCLPMVNVNGYFVPLKAEVEEELTNATNIIKTLNGIVENKIVFNLPKEEAIRTILVIKKVSSNPKGYPRNFSTIKKSLKKTVK